MDKIKGLTVVLEKDFKKEECELIINAIKQIKGVLTVDISVANIDDYINRIKIQGRMKNNLMDFIRTDFTKDD